MENDGSSRRKRKTRCDSNNNETGDESPNSIKHQRASEGQSPPSTPKTGHQILNRLHRVSPGNGSTALTCTSCGRNKSNSNSGGGSGITEKVLLLTDTESSHLKLDQNYQQLRQYVEGKQLSKYRTNLGPIYGSTSFEVERILERLEVLSESTERTIGMGLEMADGAYLMQLMNTSTPTDGIEKAWQTAHTGATLLLHGELLLKECQATLKSLVLPALRNGPQLLSSDLHHGMK